MDLMHYFNQVSASCFRPGPDLMNTISSVKLPFVALKFLNQSLKKYRHLFRMFVNETPEAKVNLYNHKISSLLADFMPTAIFISSGVHACPSLSLIKQRSYFQLCLFIYISDVDSLLIFSRFSFSTFHDFDLIENILLQNPH